MNHRTENPDTFSEDPVESLREDALEMVDKCIECGACYIDCAFQNYSDDIQQCRDWVRESNDYIRGNRKSVSSALATATLRCAECNRCHISCPENIYRRHGNMLMKHMIGNPLRHRINIHPYSNWRVKQPAIENFIVSRWKEEEEKRWYKGLNNLKEAEVLLYHGCYVYLQAAQCIRLEEMLEAAGISYTTVGKLEYCCGTFAFYRGYNDMESIQGRLHEMVERVKPERIITNCGHCYNAMHDLTMNMGGGRRPNVRHPVEELLELSIARRLDFAHLGGTYTIHDSCNFRTLHDEHGPLRSFIRRIGGIHEMLSHGYNSSCCGDVSHYYAPDDNDRYNRNVKVRQFAASGANHMVTVCAGCYENYHNKPDLKILDLIDIAYEAYKRAYAETLAEEKEELQVRWENMAPVIEEE